VANGYKRSVGGSPIIVVIDRTSAVNLTLDADYYNQTDRQNYSPRDLRYAFTTGAPISPASISFVEDDCFVKCNNFLDEIRKRTNHPIYNGLNFDHWVHGIMYRIN